MPLDRPILIVGNPRSGTTLMRSYLERSPSLWRLGRESRFLWTDLEARRDDLDALRHEVADRYARACFRHPEETADNALRFVDRIAVQGANPWYYELPRDVLLARYGLPPSGPPCSHDPGEIAPFTLWSPAEYPTEEQVRAGLRLLDKDTSHVYRIPLLRRVFPDARFVFVVRDARSAVSSLIEAWRHPRWFFSYRVPVTLRIAGYSDRFPWGDRWWNLNLPPDWRELVSRPLAEVCACVWASGNLEILAHADDLAARGQAVTVHYEELVDDPAGATARVASAVEIEPDEVAVQEGFRAPAVVTDEAPSAGKWRRNADLIASVSDVLDPIQDRLGYPMVAA
jgi:hypothetical protein